MTLQPDPTTPGLWVNPQWQPGTPGTFAVVIGVSRYDHLAGGSNPAIETYGLGQLYVSALTAYRFFAWLRDEYDFAGSPPARCWLLLAPGPAEQAALPVLADHQRTPTYAHCRDAVRDWFKLMEQLPRTAAEQSRAFFFFSGHGLEISYEKQILLPCDYLHPRGILDDAISTDNLYRGTAALAVPHQFFFLDACRNDHQRLRDEEIEGQRLLRERRSFYANPTLVAPRFHASAAGTQAWQPADPADGPSLFGQALLEGLQAQAGFQPDCDNQVCAVKIFPLQAFLSKRVRQLLAERGATVAQPVRLNGSSDDLAITLLAADRLPAPPPLSFAPAPVFETTYTLDHWTLGGAARDAGAPDPHAVFGSEQMTALWAQSRVYSFDRAEWRPGAEACQLHHLERQGSQLFLIELSIADSDGAHWLEFNDGEMAFACLLPGDRSGSPRFMLTIEYAYEVYDESGVWQAPRRLLRVEAGLARSNTGLLGETAMLWERYQHANAAVAAAAVIDLQIARNALQQKVQSPLAATVAALILLRAGRRDMLHDWLRNLAEWFPELPDGPVLWVEQLLREAPAAPPLDAIQQWLAELAMRGLPYTADALGYAGRQLDDLWNAGLPVEGLRRQVATALRFFRTGGLFATFAGMPGEVIPELVASQPVAAAPALPTGSTMPLSPDLLAALRQTLLRSEEFQSNARLRAVFALGELRPWRDGLPEAASTRERVDLTLAYLDDRRSADGVPVLATLLQELAVRYDQSDALHHELDNLAVQLGARSGATPPGESAAGRSPPSAGERRRLEQRRAGLQGELDLRYEKVAFLRRESAVSASSEQKFELQKRIENEEAAIRELEEQLHDIEAKLA